MAKQTAEVTMGSRQIDEVLNTTTVTVGQLDNVAKVISEISEIVNVMATAVEQQAQGHQRSQPISAMGRMESSRCFL